MARGQISHFVGLDEDFFDGITVEEKPRLEGLAAKIPWARPHLITRYVRRNDVWLRAVYTLYVWARQLLNPPPLNRRLPPCLGCGLPTGNFCDVCAELHPHQTAKAVCTECEPYDLACKDCIRTYGLARIRAFSAAFYAGRHAEGHDVY